VEAFLVVKRNRRGIDTSNGCRILYNEVGELEVVALICPLDLLNGLMRWWWFGLGSNAERVICGIE